MLATPEEDDLDCLVTLCPLGWSWSPDSGHCVLNEGDKKSSDVWYHYWIRIWVLWNWVAFVWEGHLWMVLHKKRLGTHRERLLCTYSITVPVHIVSDVNENSEVCCRNPIPDALAIAPSAYKNVCRFDLTKFTQKWRELQSVQEWACMGRMETCLCEKKLIKKSST